MALGTAEGDDTDIFGLSVGGKRSPCPLVGCTLGTALLFATVGYDVGVSVGTLVTVDGESVLAEGCSEGANERDGDNDGDNDAR